MHVEIENDSYGPLVIRGRRIEMEDIVHRSADLDDCEAKLKRAGFALYRGGSHIAIHPTWRGQFVDGSERVALITESKPVLAHSAA